MNARDVTKRAIIDVNSVMSGRNYGYFSSIIAQMLPSQPFPDMCRGVCLTAGSRLVPLGVNIGLAGPSFPCQKP